MEPELPLADELAAVFARLSGLLLTTETVQSLLKLITATAREVFPSALGSAVTAVGDQGAPVTWAATGEEVERADRLQYELGAGPCLTAWQESSVIDVGDLHDDDRWPEWAASAARLGLRSVLSAPMVTGCRSLGAVKVYAGRPHAFDERDRTLLTMFASQAAVLVANVRSADAAVRLSTELRSALRARDIVSMAKGVVMGRDHVSEEMAFLVLADEASRVGKPLRDNAEAMLRAAIRSRR
ncbi:GAF and ANTAR domain-containing protein [Amycolatopsis carbonis]|uniref:GAF and ANTAR domain-containing protein n=1 Tax=Amycolatopsis carbonis TaxID=715471 RepID=A0A9Y2IAW7_9PSEU|nr:GAF and ANTAR domain-containing protein [Amycolatopsis sp. 2-15]WIX75108.1 GAF and ANTAR domain-containing protein [Amycolatopsis sp. 2-15]